MAFDMGRARNYLQAFDLSGLFTQCLGWDRFRVQPFEVEAEGRKFRLEPVAEKCGFAVLACCPCDKGEIPDYPTRRKVEQRVRKLYHEHVVIFKDSANAEQKWLWVRREPGKPAVGREYTYAKGQPGDALLQRVQELEVELDDELKGLVITDVAGRVAKGLDRDKVSKKFYDRFKAELGEPDKGQGFLRFIKGIPGKDMQRWYGSVMLNRLMFIYFIEKKGFLNGDPDYLKHKLAESKQRGNDRFYSDFLCPLFFEGFAKKESERNLKTRDLLGKVPYLNGGIFMPHKELEVDNDYHCRPPIADSAFERLFAFFDEYRWHLDERPLKDEREINPDVLGYIFEKYINQKQMGAYYTKEDITEYIGRNTIIPRIFDMAKAKCKIAFESEHSVWRLLRTDPDSYIFEPVRRGVIDDKGEELSKKRLPDFVQEGMDEPKARMFEKRYNLGDADFTAENGDSLTLPTETWREYVNRRNRCLELRAKLSKGEVRDINDLITYNLDICQFAQDVIENCEGPDLLRAFYYAIAGRVPDKSNQEPQPGVSVLDPTCGSGAFLFAALNILYPLYVACLKRMRGFVEDLEKSGEKHSPEKFKDFRDILKRVGDHANEDYFIYKTIVVNNLFGVDIMEEAVEICKLRLFLKLVAQLEWGHDPNRRDSGSCPQTENYGIEPLPDIDFNIRAGNTLVGYATEAQAERGHNTDLVRQLAWPKVHERVEIASLAFQRFREMQVRHSIDAREFSDAKADVSRRLNDLSSELDRSLATEYGEANVRSEAIFKEWRRSRRPFHWFSEFYEIIHRDGFDVIIGNPPYVDYTKKDKKTGLSVRDEYEIRGYATERCGNLYCFAVERSHLLLGDSGRFGMIVPVSCIAGETYEPLARIAFHNGYWVSSYSNRPGKLFLGVEQRLVILLRSPVARASFTTGYHHWYADKRSDERATLFARLRFIPSSLVPGRGVPYKIGTPIEQSILKKLTDKRGSILLLAGKGRHSCWYHNGPTYWIRALSFEPELNTQTDRSGHYRMVRSDSAAGASLISAIISSSTFYLYFKAVSNCRDFGDTELYSFPLGSLERRAAAEMTALGVDFNDALRRTAKRCEREYPSGTVAFREYYPASAKHIIDQIDLVLAKHYGFTDEELDFIINYDIKYRMGRGAGNDEE